MNKALSFVHLDFITIKSYLTLKNLIIFAAVASIISISLGTSGSAIGILMVYAAFYVGYPFAVGEKNGIDALYTTLSIKRSTVVLGRYLFALFVDLCSGLFAFTFTFATLTIMQRDFNALESLMVLLIMFLIYSILQAIQLPIFFKLGYTKAKFLAYLPFIGLPLITLAFSNFLKNLISLKQIDDFFQWFAANPLIAVLIGIILWFGIMIISYKISLFYYNKRDF